MIIQGSADESQNSCPMMLFGILRCDLYHWYNSKAFKIVMQIKTQHIDFWVFHLTDKTGTYTLLRVNSNNKKGVGILRFDLHHLVYNDMDKKQY